MKNQSLIDKKVKLARIQVFKILHILLIKYSLNIFEGWCGGIKNTQT